MKIFQSLEAIHRTFQRKEELRIDTNLLPDLPNLLCGKLAEMKYPKTVSAVELRGLMKLLTCIIRNINLLIPT